MKTKLIKALFSFVLAVLLCTTTACDSCRVNKDRHTHNFNVVVSSIDPTCQTLGYTVKECECGATQTTSISPLQHIYNYTEQVLPTCTEDGYKRGSCSCGSESVITLTATGHSFETSYSYDNFSHWYKSTCSHTEAVSGLERHLFIDGVCKCGAVKTIVEGYATYTLSGDGDYYIATGVESGDFNKLIILSEYENKPVKEIGESTYELNTGLIEVVIPNSIEKIGEKAFMQSGIETVYISENVKEIGYCAFAGANLVRIDVSENNSNYKSVDGVLFNKGMDTLISYPALAQSNNYTIPNGVDKIEDMAFLNNENAENINLNNDLDEIGHYAFANSKKLKGMIIPDSVTSIGEQVFYGVDTFRDLTVGGINEISQFMFSNLTNLETIVIKNGITVIGKNAFNGCTKLREVTFGSTLNKIDDDAFHGCERLYSITLPASLKYIGANAFKNCINLSSVSFEVVSNWYVGTDVHFDKQTATFSNVLSTGQPHVLLKDTYVNSYWKNIE